MTLRTVSFLLLACTACGVAAESAAPSAREWSTVSAAIATGSPDAEAQVNGLIRTYPAWADGPAALAKLQLEAGRPRDALASARRASQLAPDSTDALRLQIRALADLKQKDDIYTLINNSGGKDPKGWLRYEGGLAAATLGDAAKAEALLKEAKARCGSQVPPEFQFLDSRIAIAVRDYPRAEAALATATTLQADFWDAWYELGRVRLLLAEFQAENRGTWIRRAGDAYAQVVKGLPRDAHGPLGVGQAALEDAKRLSAEDQDDNAAARLRDALTALNQAVTLKPDMAEGWMLLGDAQLRLEKWPEAAASLQKARALGATGRTLTFNLAIALQQSGNNAEAEALLKTVTADSPAEQVTLGMGAYRSKNWLVAISMLEPAARQLTDPEAAGPTWRYIGHAHRRLAESKPVGSPERESQLDAAAAAYRQAGDLGDFPARHHLMASEGARSADKAYAAAWSTIGWDTFNVTAWKTALATYGAAKTGGQGLGGMASRAPLHLAFWALLVVGPLVLFGLGLRRRKPAAATADDHSSGSQPAQPKPAKARSGTTAAPARAAEKPPARPTTSPTPPPVRPNRPRILPQKPGPKAETEPVVAPRKPAAPGKADTEELVISPALRPQVKPGIKRPSAIVPPEAPAESEQTMQPTRSSGVAARPDGALERRKP
jgi:uncharacterized protein HemY